MDSKIVQAAVLLVKQGQPKKALVLLEKSAVRRKKTKRTLQNERYREEVSQAIQRAGGTLDQDSTNPLQYAPDLLTESIDSAVTRVIQKIYSVSPKRMKVQSWDRVQDSFEEPVYLNDPSVAYWIDAHYPNIIAFSIFGEVNKNAVVKYLTTAITRELELEGETPAIIKKIARDASLLKLIGSEVLQEVTNAMVDFPNLQQTPMAQTVVDFAYDHLDLDHGASQKEHDGEYSAPKAKLYIPYPEDYVPEIVVTGPWKFRVDFRIPIAYETITQTDRRYNDYM